MTPCLLIYTSVAGDFYQQKLEPDVFIIFVSSRRFDVCVRVQREVKTHVQKCSLNGTIVHEKQRFVTYHSTQIRPEGPSSKAARRAILHKNSWRYIDNSSFVPAARNTRRAIERRFNFRSNVIQHTMVVRRGEERRWINSIPSGDLFLSPLASITPSPRRIFM